MHRTRDRLIFWAGLLLAITLCCGGGLAAEGRPNILLFVSDDQGYADFSDRGSGQVDTPQLDRLAREARVFDRFYVEPACAPTRASLLTGRSFVRTGVWNVHFGGDYIGLGERLLPEILRAVGYATGFVGKWHSGKTPGYLPHERGFELAVPVTLHDPRDNAMAINDAPRRLAAAAPFRPQPDPGWTVDRIAAEARCFLELRRDRPFFLQVAHVAPHAPWDASDELLRKYRTRGQSERFAALNATIESMDASVGRVLADLERLGLANNTVVLYVSDNGYVHRNVGRFAGELTEAEVAQRNPRGLRGNKGFIYEGGILAPLFVRWPARIRPGKTEWLGHVTDLLPTLAELAGVPAAQLPPRLDGRSLMPALLNAAAEQTGRVVFGSSLQVPARDRKHFPPLQPGRDLAAERERLDYSVAVLYARDARYKLVKNGKAGFELFDLQGDPQERDDIASQFPEVRQRLETALRGWFGEVLREPLPYANPTFVIGRSPAGVLHFNGAWKLTGDMHGNGQWAHSLVATETGSSSQWRIRVEKPGNYTVWLEADVSGPGRRVSFATDGQRIETELAEGPLHELGKLSIGANLTTASFTLLNPGTGGAPGIPELRNIVLESTPPVRSSASLQPKNLRCESLANPLAVDVSDPRLSWKLEAQDPSRRGLRQTAWQVLVSSTPERLAAGQADLWDSGQVNSSETVGLAYAGRTLPSRQICHWKVRVWNQDGNASDWSAPAVWEMGLLKPDDWSARWITRDWTGLNPERVQPPVYFRKEFNVDARKRVVRARFFATALGAYELHLDGQRVGDEWLAPQYTDYNKRALYQVYDVTERLRNGPHAIGALLGEGWYRIRESWSKRPDNLDYVTDFSQDRKDRLRVQLEIEYADGSRQTVGTGDDWKSTADGPLTRARIFDGVHYDARQEMPGWSAAGFQGGESWKAAVVSDPPKPVILSAQMNEPVRVIAEFKPLKITDPVPCLRIVDFGQEHAGVCEVTLKGPPGATVRLRHAQGVKADGTLYVANLAGSKENGDTYVLKGGTQTFVAPLVYHAYRYVEITGLASPDDLVAIKSLALSNDTPLVAAFESSDPRLNKLWSMLFWTHRSNLLGGVNTDCAARDERQGWMAEGLHTWHSANYFFNLAALTGKWHRDMRDARTERGEFTQFSPNYFPRHVPGWSDAGVILPWMAFSHSGDRRLLEDACAACQQYVDLLRQRHPNGIREEKWEENFFFHDWLSRPMRQLPGFKKWEPVTNTRQKPPFPREAFATAYFAHDAEVLSRMAGALGKTSDARDYAALAQGVRRAFVARFVDSDGRMLGAHPQGAYAQALGWRLLDEAADEKAFARLLEQIEADGGHLTTGTHTTQHLLRALADRGRSDLVWHLVMKETYPSYGYMVDAGATTVWERFDSVHPTLGYNPQGMNDLNHAGLTGVGEWIFRDVVGLRPDPTQPGYTHFIIEPKMQTGPVWVRASYDSVRGRIDCRWKREGGRGTVELVVPPNTTASVTLPAVGVASLREGGRALDRAGLAATSPATGGVALRLVAGSYRFEFELR